MNKLLTAGVLGTGLFLVGCETTTVVDRTSEGRGYSGDRGYSQYRDNDVVYRDDERRRSSRGTDVYENNQETNETNVTNVRNVRNVRNVTNNNRPARPQGNANNSAVRVSSSENTRSRNTQSSVEVSANKKGSKTKGKKNQGNGNGNG